MEIYVSLSAEVRVDREDRQDAVERRLPPTDSALRAEQLQEQARLKAEYGVDATQEEIERGEEKREKEKEDQEKRTSIPDDLGKFKPKEDQNAADIQNIHDNLIKP